VPTYRQYQKVSEQHVIYDANWHHKNLMKTMISGMITLVFDPKSPR
jgi:hypothetical protein